MTRAYGGEAPGYMTRAYGGEAPGYMTRAYGGEAPELTLWPCSNRFIIIIHKIGLLATPLKLMFD